MNWRKPDSESVMGNGWRMLSGLPAMPESLTGDCDAAAWGLEFPQVHSPTCQGTTIYRIHFGRCLLDWALAALQDYSLHIGLTSLYSASSKSLPLPHDPRCWQVGEQLIAQPRMFHAFLYIEHHCLSVLVAPKPGPEAKWANKDSTCLYLSLLHASKKSTFEHQRVSGNCYRSKLESTLTLKRKSLRWYHEPSLGNNMHPSLQITAQCKQWAITGLLEGGHTPFLFYSPIFHGAPRKTPIIWRESGCCTVVFRTTNGNQFQGTFIAHLKLSCKI